MKTGPKPRSLKERFWAKVTPGQEDECWLWQGGTRNGTDYGSIADELGNKMNVHRISFELHYRPLKKGEWVLHTCDKRPCVNPKHLYVGDRFEWARKWHGGERVPTYKQQERLQARSREYYEQNKEARKRYVRAYQLEQKRKATEVLGGKCMKCGFDHPAALQFHHRDPSLKSFSLNSKTLSMPRRLPWETILKEIEKCDLLCANCHFVHHCVWEFPDDR